MGIVLKLGGSILFEGLNLKRRILEYWTEKIHELSESLDKVVVVIGGGSPARLYIGWGRNLRLSEHTCDVLGILASRINAFLMAEYMRKKLQSLKVASKIPYSIYELIPLLDLYDVVLCGGFIPGQSTMGVAAEVAEAISSKYLLVATDVDGVYDKDPKKYPDAKRVEKEGIGRVIRRFVEYEYSAGTYKLFDVQSLKVIQRARIWVIVFNGLDIGKSDRIIEAVVGGNIEGVEKYATVIYPE